MKYIEFEELLSPNRLGRYNSACNDHILKTMSLYRANIRISQAFLPALSIFEVVLRNKIDLHYRSQFFVRSEMPEWLLASTLPGGFLTNNGSGNIIDTSYARSHFREIIEILDYMDIESALLFAGHSSVLQEANYIDSI